MLEHGGQLLAAAQRYGIPPEDWLDLSTGINPEGWAITDVPESCWRRLPESNDGLITAARDYYQNQNILPVAGSQAAIQALPQLRLPGRVGVLMPTYAEHAYNWQKGGHEVVSLPPDLIESELDHLDVLLIVNPNNPTGHTFDQQQLSTWLHRLQRKKGWLIIDEAFIDCTPHLSLSPYSAKPGLIILRSIGKFFGLAGIRCGFVIAVPEILHPLEEILGPWTLSHPSRYIATQALLDFDWHQQNRDNLLKQSLRLYNLLSRYDLSPSGGCALFQWIQLEQAEAIHNSLAKQGILTRLFNNPNSLRIGLPGSDGEWQKFENTLQKL